jgi:hypothetical protein
MAGTAVGLYVLSKHGDDIADAVGNFVDGVRGMLGGGSGPSVWEGIREQARRNTRKLGPSMLMAEGDDNSSDNSETGSSNDTQQSNAATSTGGRKPSDSSKNEKHGDGGRRLSKTAQQIKQLEGKARTATGREKKKILQKIKNIKKMAKKDKKGIEHSVGTGGKKQRGRRSRQ